MKLTPASYIVLGLLDQFGESTPYRLKRLVAASIGHFWSFQHAQLYSEPARLAEGGLVTETQEEGGRRRKLYRLTDAGQAALDEWREQPADDIGELRQPALLKLFFGADPHLIAGPQLVAHQAKLAEFEAIRDGMPADAPQGWRLALDSGIRAEREFVAYWRSVADGAAAKG